MTRSDPYIADFMPSAPDWELDWQAVTEAYGWVRAMRGSTQDPVHHAEGDVWIHTRMVVEALVGNAEWRSATYEDKLVTFAAACLHDVMKPATREVAPDGQVKNPHIHL